MKHLPQGVVPAPALRERIADLPLILAGPIVRRVDAAGAAIWIALSDPRRIELSIFAAADGSAIATASVATTALGEHFHVAVISAPGGFEWGQLYTYNLDFMRSQGSSTPAAGDLFAPGILTPPSAGTGAAEHARRRLTYVDCCADAPALPSFPTPPEDLDQVRLIHGSCRIPHAESLDALPGVDDLIAHVAGQARARPQQLFLTGDQIYANNIAPEILPAITEAGSTLLGWRELLPGIDAYPEDYPPWTREEIVRQHAGLLEWGDASHLLGLGEIYTLYLLNWSEVLWPDVFAANTRGRRMRKFVAGLDKVRRAMANLPTYMIFDDHEVTDDWYLTLEWCRSVLGKPLGRRLIMNALAAYAVFQAWGNTPAQFAGAEAEAGADSDGSPPGRQLLDALTHWRGQGDGNVDIERLLGIPAATDVGAHDPPQLVAPPGAIDWFYRVTAPSYEVLVLDGRTQRAYPGASEVDRPALLSDAAMERQIAGTGEFTAPLTIIVSSSAILPIPKPWYARAAIWCSTRWKAFRWKHGRRYAVVYSRDRGEAWSGQSPAFERLLASLAGNAKKAGDRRLLRTVILVGDIHVGHAARLQYWAERPGIGAGADRGPSDMVAAYFTSSPLHKEHAGTRTPHRIGYGLVLGPPHRQWAGWHQPPHVSFLTSPWFAGRARTPAPAHPPYMVDISNHDALLLEPPPDWHYRVDFLTATPARADGRSLFPAEITAATASHQATMERTGRATEIVGRNHFGEIRLHWREGERAARQILWWRPDDDSPLLPLTGFTSSLELDDPDHPRPALHCEGNLDQRR